MLDFLQRPIATEALAEPATARREVEGPSLELLRSLLSPAAIERAEGDAESDVFGSALSRQSHGATTAGPDLQGDAERNGRNPREERNPTYTAGVYNKHVATVDGMELDLSRYAWSVKRLQEIWTSNRSRYDNVAAQVDLPAELIAALHFRESSGDFHTYLHQGDPLGRPAVNHPRNIPVFHNWEDAAVHALSNRHKTGIQDDLDITEDTEDMAALGSYAEYYNGLGYHNRDRVSPYVYAGTDHYTGGKYVRDGVFDSNAMDRQLGVLAMVQVLKGEADSPLSGPGLALGERTLKSGLRGNDVRELQALLNGVGAGLQVDGDFGEGTEQAVKDVQRQHGLTEDGVVGPSTLAVLNAPSGSTSSAPEPSTARGTPAEDPPMPTHRPVAELGTTLLREGSRGDSVRALQQHLASLGQGIAVDGVFGRNTGAAVKWFQRSRGLSADGVVGAQTRMALSQE